MSELPNSPKSVGLAIYWNGVLVDQFNGTNCTLMTSTYYLIAVNGSNQILFQGLGLPDCWGVLIRNVRLQRLVYASNTNSSVSNSTNSSINSNSSLSSTGINGSMNYYNSTNSSNISNGSNSGPLTL